MKLVTIGASCEAEGHPSECTAVVSGAVQSTSEASMSVSNADGSESDLATIETADIHFDSHAHDHTSEEGCHQNESHDIDPSTTSTSLTLNTSSGTDSAIYVTGSGVATDPTSGGDVNITDAGDNNSVSETA